MQDILSEIVAHKHMELEQLCAKKASLREALLHSDTGIIAEFKRKSPSKGWIKEDGRADQIPLSYQQNGAAALSILTDEQYFGGSDDFIRQARQSGVTLPILYKNFVINEAQLYAAALCGASASASTPSTSAQHAQASPRTNRAFLVVSMASPFLRAPKRELKKSAFLTL